MVVGEFVILSDDELASRVISIVFIATICTLILVVTIGYEMIGK